MRSKIVPASVLGALGRWDADHVFAVIDKAEKLGVALDDAEGLRKISRKTFINRRSRRRKKEPAS